MSSSQPEITADHLKQLLDKVSVDGPLLSLEESEQLLNALANAARTQDARDAIIAADVKIDRNVFWLAALCMP
jgi:hypothetical protein